MKTIYSILFILLFVFPDRQEPQPLFEGIYTETGYGVTDKNKPLNSGMTRSYYVKIYENKLVVTTQQYGSVSTIDIPYQHQGKNQDGDRVYSSGASESYWVDQNYDIMRVSEMPSIDYGTNVMDYWYWEIVKGDQRQQYEEEHRRDGSSIQMKVELQQLTGEYY